MFYDSPVKIVDKLNREQIQICQEESHPIWGGEFLISKRIDRLHDFLNFDDGKWLSFCGIVDDKGYPLTTMKKYHLPLMVKEVAYSGIGIGAVFTSPKERRKGLAEALIQYTVNKAKDNGYQFAILFSDISAKYYEKLDFLRFPSLNFSLSKKSSEGFKLEIEIANNEEELIDYYERLNASQFRMKRGKKYWNFSRKREACGKDYWLLFQKKRVGYFSGGEAKEKWWLDELFVEPIYMESALNSILGFAEKSGKLQITGFVHPTYRHQNMIFYSRCQAIPMIRTLVNGLQQWEEKDVWLGSIDHF